MFFCLYISLFPLWIGYFKGVSLCGFVIRWGWSWAGVALLSGPADTASAAACSAPSSSFSSELSLTSVSDTSTIIRIRFLHISTLNYRQLLQLVFNTPPSRQHTITTLPPMVLPETFFFFVQILHL
jgi:hypothetical protein